MKKAKRDEIIEYLKKSTENIDWELVLDLLQGFTDTNNKCVEKHGKISPLEASIAIQAYYRGLVKLESRDTPNALFSG